MNNLTVQSFQIIDSHLYGDTFIKMLRLRHKGFIEEQGYEVYDWNGLDFDQYDNPFTHYITISQNKEVIACVRFNKTNFHQKICSVEENGNKNCASVSFMVKDQWANKIPQEFFSNLSDSTWEVSRLYVDSGINVKDRASLSRILLVITYIIGERIGVKNLIYVTHKLVISTLNKVGIEGKKLHEIAIEGFEGSFLVSNLIDKNRIPFIVDKVLDSTGIDVLALIPQKTQERFAI